MGLGTDETTEFNARLVLTGGLFFNKIILGKLTVSDINPSEACVHLLHRLTADGNLSGSELWTLAEWLNEHPEATEVWPGSVLVGPLAAIFEDGNVDEAELQVLAEMIVEIEREWSQRKASAVHLAPEALTPATLDNAFLPRVPWQTQIDSLDEGVFEVDLYEQTCSCPDWERHRNSRPVGDIGRCCKHMAEAYTRVESRETTVFPWLDALFKDFIERGRGAHPQEEWCTSRIGDQDVLISKGPASWCHIYCQGAQGYDRFAFNTEERRWSYGRNPGPLAPAAEKLFSEFPGPSN